MEIISYVGFDKKDKRERLPSALAGQRGHLASTAKTSSASRLLTRSSLASRTITSSHATLSPRSSTGLRSPSAAHTLAGSRLDTSGRQPLSGAAAPSVMRSGWSASSINTRRTPSAVSRITADLISGKLHTLSEENAAKNTPPQSIIPSAIILSARTRETGTLSAINKETPPAADKPQSINSIKVDAVPASPIASIPLQSDKIAAMSKHIGAQAAAITANCRSPLAYIGMFASAALRAVPGTLAFITAAAAGSILVLGADWYASHTGPLALQDGSTAELDALSSIMLPFGGHSSQAIGTVDELGALAEASCPVIKSAVTWQTYTVRPGDTIIGLSRRFGLENISTIIAVNGVDNARAIQAGKKIRIPSMDGLVHTVKAGNSLAGLSAKYSVSVEDILDVNDLSTKELSLGQEIFIPGAVMDNTALREAMGDLFKCPIKVAYRLSSHYGWRADPFTGVRSYHSGVDMACPQGTPIYAAMGGKVITAGWSNVFGNYVIVDHQNGYQSLYGHMSKRIARKGQIVNQGDRLGLVGSTGYSTGPHLHFTVYKRGKLTDPMVLLRR